MRAVSPRSCASACAARRARPRGAGRLEHLLVALLRGSSSPSRCATSASTSSGGVCSTRSMPVARYSSSAFSFSASLRSSCSDGTQLTGFEPGRCTRQSATGRQELALREAGREARLLESPTDCRRVVDMGVVVRCSHREPQSRESRQPHRRSQRGEARGALIDVEALRTTRLDLLRIGVGAAGMSPRPTSISRLRASKHRVQNPQLPRRAVAAPTRRQLAARALPVVPVAA